MTAHTLTAGTPWTSARRIVGRIGWFAVWAFVTTFVWFEVAKHGWMQGSPLDAALLTSTAVLAFIAPDLTFLVGVGEPTPKGHLPKRAVPFYNAMHRFWPPLLITTGVGIAFDPLGPAGLIAFVAGLSWMAHVALDRVAGYGLRNPDGSR